MRLNLIKSIKENKTLLALASTTPDLNTMKLRQLAELPN